MDAKMVIALLITHSTTKPESMDTVQARSRRSRTVIEQGIKGDDESKGNGGMNKKVNSIPANVRAQSLPADSALRFQG